MKSELLSVAVAVIDMVGGIILVIAGGTNQLDQLVQIGSGILTLILGVVLGQNAPNLIGAVKHLMKGKGG